MATQASPAQAIGQLIIDLPALQQFLHSELVDRKPLVLIETGEMTRDLALQKFGQPVVIRSMDEAKGRPFLHIKTLKVSGSIASAQFEYPIEGVGGEAEFEKKAESWTVTKSEIWER